MVIKKKQKLRKCNTFIHQSRRIWKNLDNCWNFGPVIFEANTPIDWLVNMINLVNFAGKNRKKFRSLLKFEQRLISINESCFFFSRMTIYNRLQSASRSPFGLFARPLEYPLRLAFGKQLYRQVKPKGIVENRAYMLRRAFSRKKNKLHMWTIYLT